MPIPTKAEARALLAELVPNYYLIENEHRIRHPKADGGQFNRTRRSAPWGRGPIPQGQLHSYEAPHTRSLIAAADYIVTRTSPGSYHFLAGDDDPRDVLPMAPVTCEVWHCIPSNPWAIGGSCVMYANSWRRIPKRSRDNLVKSLAYGFYLASLELIALGKSPIPAKRITRAQAMAGVWGFNMHRHMDPGRRTDIANPESDFPWNEFFAEYTRLLGGNPTQEDDVTTDAQMRQINTWIENIHKDIKATLPGLVADAVWTFVTSSEPRSGWTMLRRVTDAAQATNAALPEIAGRVGASINTDAIADALAEPLMDALQHAGQGVDTATIKAALREVFADAAAGGDTDD